MSSKKDMRRADLIVPYKETISKGDDTDIMGTIASTAPMAAMFTRNKMISWVAVVFNLQNWISETPTTRANAKTPAMMAFGISLMSLVLAYINLFFPAFGVAPNPGAGTGTGTGAPAASPEAAPGVA